MSARRARDEVDARRADARRTRGSARVTPGTRAAASVAVAIAMASRLVDNDTVEHVGTGDVSKSQRVRSIFGKSESPFVRVGPSPPGHSSARARGGEPPAAMYNVLGKSKGGQTEEQSLARLNDQCNRLMRQIEGSIEQAEVARSKRFALGDDDPVMGIPKPGEDLWSEAYADHERMVAATLLRSPGDAVRDAPSTSRARGDSDAPARHPVSPSRALESTSTSRAHARDPPRPVEDKALADEAFRQGQAALDAGQARAALAHFRRAHEACPNRARAPSPRWSVSSLSRRNDWRWRWAARSPLPTARTARRWTPSPLFRRTDARPSSTFDARRRRARPAAPPPCRRFGSSSKASRKLRDDRGEAHAVAVAVDAI